MYIIYILITSCSPNICQKNIFPKKVIDLKNCFDEISGGDIFFPPTGLPPDPQFTIEITFPTRVQSYLV